MKYFTADVIDGNIRMKHHESVAVAVAPDDEDRAQGVAVCGLLQRGMCRPAWLARSDFVSKKRALQLARTTTHGARRGHSSVPTSGGHGAGTAGSPALPTSASGEKNFVAAANALCCSQPNRRPGSLCPRWLQSS
jgi:hypothetical protein